MLKKIKQPKFKIGDLVYVMHRLRVQPSVKRWLVFGMYYESGAFYYNLCEPSGLREMLGPVEEKRLSATKKDVYEFAIKELQEDIRKKEAETRKEVNEIKEQIKKLEKRRK